MFNLEQAIADWRQKMLAAGIEAPVPLEELELHLREEVERLMGNGISGEEALALAVKNVGEAHPLKVEFQKAGSISRFGFQRIYELMLAVYAAFTGVVTMGMIFGNQLDRSLFASGSVAAFWMGLSGNGVVRTVISIKSVAAAQSLQSRILAAWQNAQAANHLPTAVILLNVIYFTAIVATLWVRNSRPQQRLRVTRMLNWALLPALPFGTMIGLYGYWCIKMENYLEQDETRLGQSFILQLKRLPDANLTTGLKLKALFGRAIFALALGLAGSVLIFIGCIEVLKGILMPSTPPELHLGFRLSHPLLFIIILLGLFVGTWILCWMLQIIQSLREFGARKLEAKLDKVPVTQRSKIIQIIACLYLGIFGLTMLPDGVHKLAATHLSLTFSDGSNLGSGLFHLIGGTYLAAYGLIKFLRLSKEFSQKATR